MCPKHSPFLGFLFLPRRRPPYLPEKTESIYLAEQRQDRRWSVDDVVGTLVEKMVSG